MIAVSQVVCNFSDDFSAHHVAGNGQKHFTCANCIGIIEPMELNNEQKQKVTEWIANGDSLAEVQRKLASELKISLTYMEARFLVDDLGLALKNKEKRPPVSTSLGTDKKTQTDTQADLVGNGDEPAEPAVPDSLGGPSKISVEVDRLTKPGSVVSGTVTFSDGVSAAWMLDAYGRLALSTKKEGYKPGPEDLRAFQQELARQLQSRGF